MTEGEKVIQYAIIFEASTGSKLILDPAHREWLKELGIWEEIEPHVYVSEYLKTN